MGVAEGARGTGAGTLWIVATPIGNLDDISLRALQVLREASVVACEDTRTTRKLIARHDIQARLVSCHEHNERQRGSEIAEMLEAGESVALVTDAGTPGVSDPGRLVVEAALSVGADVVPIPGPSAAIAALAASALPSERFTFFGFAPVKGSARAEFMEDVAGSTATAILYESPHRMVRTMNDLAELTPDRRASLHREMTKLHEETIRGTVREIAGKLAQREPRGEYTLVLAPADAAAPRRNLEAAVAHARELVAGGEKPSAAARVAAAREGVPRRVVYAGLVGGDDWVPPAS